MPPEGLHAPTNAWAWCYYGRACIELGHDEEARQALETALELEQAGSFETDAGEFLASLG